MVYIKSYSHIFKKEKTNMVASDIALIPAKEVMASVNSEEIDSIICATITKDYVYPSTACMLGSKINAVNAFCFDIESDFTGFISAIKLAYSFVKSGRYKKVLAVAVESTGICDDDNFTDGAIVALVCDEKSDLSIDFIDFETSGDKLTNCYIPMGGAAKPYTKEGVLNKEHFISIKDNKVFDEAAVDAAEYTNSVIEKYSYKADYLIPSYSGKSAYEAFVKNIKFNKENIYSKMSDEKSSVSASSGIALSMAIKEGFIKDKSKIIVSAYGSGYTKAVLALSYKL